MDRYITPPSSLTNIISSEDVTNLLNSGLYIKSFDEVEGYIAISFGITSLDPKNLKANVNYAAYLNYGAFRISPIEWTKLLRDIHSDIALIPEWIFDKTLFSANTLAIQTLGGPEGLLIFLVARVAIVDPVSENVYEPVVIFEVPHNISLNNDSLREPKIKDVVSKRCERFIADISAKASGEQLKNFVNASKKRLKLVKEYEDYSVWKYTRALKNGETKNITIYVGPSHVISSIVKAEDVHLCYNMNLFVARISFYESLPDAG